MSKLKRTVETGISLYVQVEGKKGGGGLRGYEEVRGEGGRGLKGQS